MQIRTRLTVQFTLLVSGILLVSFLVIYYFTYTNTKDDFYDRLKSKATSMAVLQTKVKSIDNELLKIIDETNRGYIFNSNIFIFDEKNRLIYSNVATPAIHLSNFWLDEIRKSKEIRYTDGDYYVVGFYYKEYRFNNVVVLLGAQDLSGKVNLSNLRDWLIVLFISVTAIVAIVGWLFAQRALLPISKVMNELEGILPQKLDTRLDVPNQKDEIGRLVTTFNELLNRIENAFRLQKTFVANVSHELKNPLTKISSQLEVSLLKTRDTEEYQKTITSVLEDIRELTQLSNALLELAKVSEDRNVILTDRIRIDEVLWDARTILHQVKKNYRIQVDLGELPDEDTFLELRGNASLLKTAFLNLIENACKFSDDHTVQIRLTTTANAISLSFINLGKEIPKTEQALIFQPFYRSNKTADVKGYGIGLSLVERIVRLHGGSISAHSLKPSMPEGNEFRIIFPRKGSL